MVPKIQVPYVNLNTLNQTADFMIYSMTSRSRLIIIGSLMVALLLVGCSGSNGGNNTPTTADPLADGVQNGDGAQAVTVDFDITVPAYSSNALQVVVIWGDKTLNASWVGDEMWSATAEFPQNTEHQLLLTFYEDNGAVPLASFEQSFRTGATDFESVTITANQFNADLWDSDNDGVSNLAELIAGSNLTDSPSVLLFSETRGYRHDSIESALQALEQLAASNNIQTARADDSTGLFTEANLASYDAVVWVLTSGDVLDNSEQAAFERFIRAGGGYAGIHAASDTEYEWPWYGDLVGAYFSSHPEIQSATQIVELSSHPSTAHLSLNWTRTDEWYDFRANPRSKVNVLMRLDEQSYSGGLMGEDHPSAWFHEYDGGRSWYTAGGHTEESYAEPDFRAHLLGGLQYVVGR